MANEEVKKRGVVEEKKTIEEWKKELRVKDHIFCGVVAEKGWLSGKKVTHSEFDGALSDFLQGGRK